MKRLLYLLPIFLSMLACGTQPLPTRDVSYIVNATLTSIAQSNSQVVTPQSAFTPAAVQEQPTPTAATSPALHYYWPASLPEGFVLDTSTSNSSANGFTLEFDNFSEGKVLLLLGGDDANFEYCPENSTPHIIKGFDGCFPQSTGGGFSVEWKEASFHYVVGGMGLSQDFVLKLAEQLVSLDINTWQERLNK